MPIVSGHRIIEWHGQAVPWTTAWSGEAEPRLYLTRDRRVLVSCLQAPGVGTPVFASNHPTRLARAIIERLCSVCGEHIDEPWAWCVPMDLRTGAQTTLLAEPATHEECLRFACTACPALVRRRPPIWRLRGWRTHYLDISLLRDAAEIQAKVPPEMVPLLASTIAYMVDGPVRVCKYEEFLQQEGDYLLAVR